MIVASAALFAACAENQEINEISTQGPVIGFNSFTQKATKAENSSASYTWLLEDHHSDFKVWGYKNNSADAVFNGERVYIDNNGTTDNKDDDFWAYVNNRYWDKASTDYYYYACAPFTSSPFTFKGVSTNKATDAEIAASKASQPSGYFTIETAYTKAGENVSAYAKSNVTDKDYNQAATTKTESWTKAGATTDVDLLIAEECHLSGTNLTTAMNTKVQLNFIHVLSRLNITAKTVKDEGFFPQVNTGDKIVIDEITIGNMMTSGTFDESTTITGNLDAGQYARWTTTTKANYKYEINYLADQETKYVIEALMLPQAVEMETINADGTGTIEKPYLYIKYTIWNNAKDAGQTYEAYYNLATILTKKTNVEASNTAFNEGWQNNINITISPNKIDFDANVAEWADTNTNDLVIY